MPAKTTAIRRVAITTRGAATSMPSGMSSALSRGCVTAMRKGTTTTQEERTTTQEAATTIPRETISTTGGLINTTGGAAIILPGEMITMRGAANTLLGVVIIPVETIVTSVVVTTAREILTIRLEEMSGTTAAATSIRAGGTIATATTDRGNLTVIPREMTAVIEAVTTEQGTTTTANETTGMTGVANTAQEMANSRQRGTTAMPGAASVIRRVATATPTPPEAATTLPEVVSAAGHAGVEDEMSGMSMPGAAAISPGMRWWAAGARGRHLLIVPGCEMLMAGTPAIMIMSPAAGISRRMTPRGQDRACGTSGVLQKTPKVHFHLLTQLAGIIPWRMWFLMLRKALAAHPMASTNKGMLS